METLIERIIKAYEALDVALLSKDEEKIRKFQLELRYLVIKYKQSQK